ncbi:MAG: hypothetical protein JWP97_1746 [Labilithrix sp.]|nr:hypothetical protein [Labilithrix sp.]
MTRRALLVAALLAAPACAAPSSFDGVTGGVREDDTLEAPRPVSPVSVSMVASSRPRLTWSLARGATGAVVELARTRDFAKEVKTFSAAGSELKVPADLEPGIWFWRLGSAAGAAVGTKRSVVWEVLARGPAAHGESDAPSRGLVDMNGDGLADLLVAATADDSGDASPVVLFYPGTADRGFSSGGKEGFLGVSGSAYDGPISLGGGTDLDGDGYTDLLEAGSYAHVDQGATWFDASVTYATGGRSDLTFDLDRGGPLFTGAPSSGVPSVREGGDVDGDGYGDAVVGMDDVGYVVLGAVATLSSQPALLPIGPGANVGAPGTTRVAFGGFDANGDGLSDVAFSFASAYEPSARAFVAPGDRGERVAAPTMLDAPEAKRAVAFAAGDFDGDGLDDLAVTTPLSGASRLCVWYGRRDTLLAAGPCLTAGPGEVDLGASLTAADLEGDGVDELLASVMVGGVAGVRVVRIVAGAASASAIGDPGLGVRLTTIWPGRPGKARWAAAAADGTRIAIYEGTVLQETLAGPPGTVSGFGRGLR